MRTPKLLSTRPGASSRETIRRHTQGRTNDRKTQHPGKMPKTCSSGIVRSTPRDAERETRRVSSG